ncbi:MAG: acetylhydrolase, partial [Anaerolineae bacterium]|nr:acetylhydrolase [Anaerolineae bacterium]
MGTTILIIAMVVEVAFAIYCMVTQSVHEKVRSLARVGGLAGFILAALVGVVQWGGRWYLLAALLLGWAGLGAWNLARQKGEKLYGPGRVVFRGVLALALVAVAVIPALLFPPHRPPKVTGQLPVATATYTYTDPNRVETFTTTGENRQVNVEFWYPQSGGGPYPLVVFSHGAFGMKGSNTSTFIELASHGYVVCSIDHPYHSLFTRGADGKAVMADRAFLQEFMNSNKDVYDGKTQIGLYQKWMQVRTADINLVLDTILQQAQGGGEGVYRLVDTAKLGLMGHSLGGAAAVQLGRDRRDITAVANLDGTLLGEYLDFVNGKPVINQAPYPVPILSIYSDDMLQVYAQSVAQGFASPREHIAATAPHAYEVHIAGTNHLSLTDVPLDAPFLIPLMGNPKGLTHEREADKYYVIETMNATVLEFFDAYLK